jgi:hypothetical protein
MEPEQGLVSKKRGLVNRRGCCSTRNYFQMKRHSWMMGLEQVNKKREPSRKVLGSIRSCFPMRNRSWIGLELGLDCKSRTKDTKIPGWIRKTIRWIR